MDSVVYDIETNGFLDHFDTVHCLVLKDLDTGQVLSCTDASPDYPGIEEGLRVLSQARRVYGHNIIRFDHPALKKAYPDFEITGTALDTIVVTRLRFAHIKRSDFARAKKGILPGHLIGRQSIESWGYRLGVMKTDYKDWCKKQGIEEPFAIWRPEMQSYCEQDVDVNEALIVKLREVGGFPQEALEIDMDCSWYLAQQERNGWPIDEENLMSLVATLTTRQQELEEKLIDHFGSWCVPKDDPKTGWVPKRSNSRYGYIEGVPCVRIDWIEFNPGSRNHIANRLQELYGWEPKEFTPTGQPKVDESTLKGLSFPISDVLNEYLLVDKRLGQIANGKEAWMKHLDGSGYQGGALTGMQHVHHSISQVTVTHRGRHSHPNLGQVPAAKSPYGKECRSVFTVPAGWDLVGSDASGLELRCLAHYMAKYDDGEYGKIILEGDIHSENQKAAGLPTRDNAKTFIYAWLYGAGDQKIGSIVDPTGSDNGQQAAGRKLKGQFLKAVPALAYLQKAVQRASNTKGYVLLPDGRRAYIRHKHAALNTLLQGAGAIICKAWIQEFNRRLIERFGTPAGGGWEHEWAAVGWIHDEVQVAARKEHSQEVADTLVASMPVIGERFEWRIPLEADASIGSSWADTH